MYRHFKQGLFIIVLALSTLLATSCNSQKKTNESNSGSENIKQVSISNINTDELSLLYFHATRRCATCEAVEKVAKEALSEFYGDSIVFHSINREEQQELARQYDIEWQTLLIVNGDRKLNLTNEAFLNARTNPDKLKATIKSAIDSLR